MKKWTRSSAASPPSAAQSISNERRLPVGYQCSVGVGAAQPEPRVKTWVAAQSLDTLFISAVSFGELRKGIILRAPGKRRTELELWLETDLSILFSGILPLTRSIAERWDALDGQRQLMGRPLNVPEGQIAATALEHGLTPVTRHVKDFADLGVDL